MSTAITAETTRGDITAHLDAGGVSYTETPDGLIRCELSGDRRLNLYQAEQQDGADQAGVWGWYLVDDCSGRLDSFDELTGLVIWPGDRVEAGEGDGHDTGTVRSVSGDEAEIGWDSGVITSAKLADLRLI